MESLIADFDQFSCAIAKFLFLESKDGALSNFWAWFWDFAKISWFP